MLEPLSMTETDIAAEQVVTQTATTEEFIPKVPDPKLLADAQKEAAELLEGESTAQEQARTLRNLGLNRRVATKILAGAKNPKFLNKRVAAHISLVMYMESADKTRKMMNVTAKIASTRGMDNKVRIAAATCTAQCANIIGNLAAKVKECAEEYGENDPPKPPKKPPQVNLQVNVGFPPVAQPKTS